MDDKTWRINLEKWREERNLTESEAATLAGVSQSTINHYENGNRPFTQSTLDKLLKFYKKNYLDLFTKEIPEIKKPADIKKLSINPTKKMP